MGKKSAVVSVIVTGKDDGASKVFTDTAKAADGLGESTKKAGQGFDIAKDKAGESERKFIGLKDSITGTGDVMTGLREGNIVTLSQGLADLAGAVESLGVDALAAGKKLVGSFADQAKAVASTGLEFAKSAASLVAQKAAAIASTVATQAQTAAQWLLNAAMTANPILLVVVALAALTAGFVLLWKNSETFREIVTGAFDAVKGAAEATWNWVSDHWPLLLAILTGPFGIAVALIKGHWSEIKGAATDAWQWISGKATAIKDVVLGIPAALSGAFTGMFDGIKDAWKAAWNWIIDKWNGLEFKMPEVDTHIPGVGKVGGWALGTPDLPRLALGGITTGPSIAGEAGREAVIPLDSARGRGALSGIGGATIVIQGDVYGDRDFLRKLEDGIAQLARRGSPVL